MKKNSFARVVFAVFAFFCLGFALCAQPALPAFGSTDFAAAQTAFDAAYWPAQPDAVRALQNPNMDLGTRWAIGDQLAQQGFVIDSQIMILQNDPYMVMYLRAFYGYAWVPGALQGALCADASQYLRSPYCTPYNPNSPPLGAVKVDMNPADYPVADPSFVLPSGTN